MKTLEAIFDACAANPHRGVFALVGPTGFGKTRWVANLAIQRGQPLVVINPQWELEEEIAGYLYLRKGKDITTIQYSDPPALLTAFKAKQIDPSKPWTLFIDELDKARYELLTSMLTLFNPDERRLREYRLGPHVTVCAAMNPPQATLPDPLLSRLLLLPFPADESYFQWSGNSLIKELHGLPEIKLPTRPDSPSSTYKLMQWFDSSEFWSNDDIKNLVIRGLYNKEKAGMVLDKIKLQCTLSPLDIIRTASPLVIADKIIDLYENAIPTLKHGEVITELQKRAETDVTGEINRIYRAFFTPNVVPHLGKGGDIEKAREELRKNLVEKK